MLKGKSKPLRAFEPLSGERSGSPAIAAYREAYEKLEAGDPGARQAFAAIIGLDDNEPLATFHLQRLLSGGGGVEIELAIK